MEEELFDIITKDRTLLNKTAKRGNILPRNEYHLVVMGILVNNNKILITKRSKNKPGAGKWECTAGSVLSKETSKDAIKREIKEEIGIDVIINHEKPIGEFYEDDAIFDIWKFNVSINIEDLTLQESEVEEAKYVNIEEMKSMVQTGECTSSFIEVIKLYEQGKI